MLTQYHIEICQGALVSKFSGRALSTIIEANIAQDDLPGQIGHPEYHFDDSAFELWDMPIWKNRGKSSSILYPQTIILPSPGKHLAG